MTKAIASDGQNGRENAVYARYLPDHLQARYVESLEDRELLHLRRQVALLEVRIKQLLETIDRKVMSVETMTANIASEFPDLDAVTVRKLAEYVNTFLPESFIDARTFRSLERLVRKYETAMVDKRLIQAHEALAQLFSAIEDGRRDSEIWKEINAAMDQQRKLIEAEQRRVVSTQESMTLEKAVKLIEAVIQSLREAVVRYVPDRDVQASILGEAQAIYRGRLTGTIDLQPDAERMD